MLLDEVKHAHPRKQPVCLYRPSIAGCGRAQAADQLLLVRIRPYLSWLRHLEGRPHAPAWPGVPDGGRSPALQGLSLTVT